MLKNKDKKSLSLQKHLKLEYNQIPLLCGNEGKNQISFTLFAPAFSVGKNGSLSTFETIIPP